MLCRVKMFSCLLACLLPSLLVCFLYRFAVASFNFMAQVLSLPRLSGRLSTDFDKVEEVSTVYSKCSAVCSHTLELEVSDRGYFDE
jgi:hypothetical protein